MTYRTNGTWLTAGGVTSLRLERQSQIRFGFIDRLHERHSANHLDRIPPRQGAGFCLRHPLCAFGVSHRTQLSQVQKCIGLLADAACGTLYYRPRKMPDFALRGNRRNRGKYGQPFMLQT